MTPFEPPAALVLMGDDTFRVQFDERRLARLRSLGRFGEPMHVDDLHSPRVAEALAGIEVLVTGWGAARIDDALLARMPRLRGLFHCAGTVRPIVTEGFWTRGIAVSNGADANAIPVAEFTFAAIILAGKKAPFLAADARVHREDWSYATGRGELTNVGRTIGVVGFSRIGRRVVSLLQQLDSATVLVADPYADPYEVAAAGARLVPLDELLPRVDVLSIHAPALPSTRHMIGAEQLARLRRNATVINTARGSLIDTAALERECAAGRLHAILDVTDPEPLPADSVLYDLPNVMLTPHVAGSLGSEIHRMTDAALDELERYVRGEALQSAVSSETLRVSA